MSALDTMTPLLATPWIDASGKTLSVRALPGLRPELIKTLNSAYPGADQPNDTGVARDLLRSRGHRTRADRFYRMFLS